MITTETALYVAGVVFIATVVRTALGFGEALIAVPLLALRLPILLATPLAVAISIIVATIVVARDWRDVELRSAGWLAFASFFGIPAGVYLIARVNDQALRGALGAIVAAFGLYAARGLKTSGLVSDARRWLCGAGFVAGVMGGAYGMNGPPLAIYGALRGWPPERFRATLQAYFLIASLAGLFGYVGAGLVTPTLAEYLLVSVPGVAGGVVLGRAIASRVDHSLFVRWVYSGLVIMGLVLLAESLRP